MSHGNLKVGDVVITDFMNDICEIVSLEPNEFVKLRKLAKSANYKAYKKPTIICEHYTNVRLFTTKDIAQFRKQLSDKFANLVAFETLLKTQYTVQFK